MKPFIQHFQESTSGVTEAYAQELANMDKMIGKALGVGKSRKSGRTEFEYSGIPGHAKAITVNFGGEDDPYVIVTVGGKEHDISKGKTLAADVAKYLGVKVEGIDHRALGKRGQYDITDVGRPVKGELLDYYDRNGDKHQGKVKSVNAQDVMTLTDTATGETVKLTLVKP